MQDAPLLGHSQLMALDNALGPGEAGPNLVNLRA